MGVEIKVRLYISGLFGMIFLPIPACAIDGMIGLDG